MIAMNPMQSVRALSLATFVVLFVTDRSFAEDKSGPYTGLAACTDRYNNCADTCNNNRLMRSGDDYEACIGRCGFAYKICGNATPDVAKSGTRKKAPSAKK